MPAALDKEPIVLVDQSIFEKMDIIFGGELARPLFDVREGKLGDVPSLENALWR
jgi:hypothetical protein